MVTRIYRFAASEFRMFKDKINKHVTEVRSRSSQKERTLLISKTTQVTHRKREAFIQADKVILTSACPASVLRCYLTVLRVWHVPDHPFLLLSCRS